MPSAPGRPQPMKVEMLEGRGQSTRGCGRWATFMMSNHTGSAMMAPVQPGPSFFFWSKPIQMPQVYCLVKPMYQASV